MLHWINKFQVSTSNCFSDPVCCPLAFFWCQTHSPSAWLNAHFSPKIRESSVYQDSSLILLNYRFVTSERQWHQHSSWPEVHLLPQFALLLHSAVFFFLQPLSRCFSCMAVFYESSSLCHSFVCLFLLPTPSISSVLYLIFLIFSQIFYLFFLFPFLIFALWSFSLFPSSVRFPLLPESRLRSLFSSVFLSLITLFLCFASSESASIFSSSLLPSYSSHFLSPWCFPLQAVTVRHWFVSSFFLSAFSQPPPFPLTLHPPSISFCSSALSSRHSAV